MKLISEQAEKFSVVQPKDQDDPQFYLEGVFLQANIKNRNGRVYPLEIMEREVARYKQQYVDTKRAFGELGHPDNPSINLERTSHLITDIWQDGEYFNAKAKILDTPYGNIVKAMIKEGCQLGVSSRALGSVVNRNGTDYVQDDFRLVTAGDIVWEPSAQTAFPKGIMEDVEWLYDPEKDEYYKSEVTEQQKTQHQMEMFRALLQNIASKSP